MSTSWVYVFSLSLFKFAKLQIAQLEQRRKKNWRKQNAQWWRVRSQEAFKE